MPIWGGAKKNSLQTDHSSIPFDVTIDVAWQLADFWHLSIVRLNPPLSDPASTVLYFGKKAKSQPCPPED
jgi:hypothetical protein